MITKYLKKHLPQSAFLWAKRMVFAHQTNKEMRYHRNKVLHFSSPFNYGENSSLSDLMITSHVLEKGITMPGRRLGFGYERVRDIVSKSDKIIGTWGADSAFLQATLMNLKQYIDIHDETKYELPQDIVDGIKGLLPYLKSTGENCYSVTKEQYFAPTKDFAEFAHSRHSIRWFAETPVDDQKLMAAIRLAQTAPSACNRQGTRVKIISSKEGKDLCCKLQNGNRGFGDKADKWLLVTSELGHWASINLHAPYVDGGIFTMNLLYALHYYGIVACTLNAHLDNKKREVLYKGLGVPESELPIAFIVIGNPVDTFMVPKSQRMNVEEIVQKI